MTDEDSEMTVGLAEKVESYIFLCMAVSIADRQPKLHNPINQMMCLARVEHVGLA